MFGKDTVYILGAGFNQCVKGVNGLRPPLSTNFFNTILKSKRYNNTTYSEKTNLVYEYIYRYWKKSKNDLLNEEFDLEECFTVLQLQLLAAAANSRSIDVSNLSKINSLLKFMFVEFLSEFEVFSSSSDLMIEFGTHIYNEKPTILTFNYDCNLEKAIETASGIFKKQPKENNSPYKDNKDELPRYSPYNWNCSLSYGIRFNKIQLKSDNAATYITGDTFYSSPENNLYDWSILKLHGSLNWFKCVPAEAHNDFKSNYLKTENKNINAEIILADSNTCYDQFEHLDKVIIDPLIIPPVLYKEYNQQVISNIWQQAKEKLSTCKNLIVIGYSFPPTDFGIKKLLLEALEYNRLENLIVVNPNTSIVGTIKRLTHYDKPVLVCNDLNEFLQSIKNY